MSLSTDDPLHCHNVDDALMEEYFNASQSWGFTEVDLCEMARTSVLNSYLCDEITETWTSASVDMAVINDSAETLVPDIRVYFRRDTLADEHSYLQRTAASIFSISAQDEDLEEAFKIMDDDGGGTIDSEELTGCLSKLGEKMSSAEIRAIIKGFDTSGTGEISLADFKLAFNRPLVCILATTVNTLESGKHVPRPVLACRPFVCHAAHVDIV